MSGSELIINKQLLDVLYHEQVLKSNIGFKYSSGFGVIRMDC